jgi:hypothetical protein
LPPNPEVLEDPIGGHYDERVRDCPRGNGEIKFARPLAGLLQAGRNRVRE